MVVYRQGDVFLKSVDKDLSKLKRHKDNILALGESTGHMHEITMGDVYVDENGTLFVDATKGGRIEHHVGGRLADHHPIDMVPLVYEYVPQREYTPDGWEKVID